MTQTAAAGPPQRGAAMRTVVHTRATRHLAAISLISKHYPAEKMKGAQGAV
jgi:hypothetical protein